MELRNTYELFVVCEALDAGGKQGYVKYYKQRKAIAGKSHYLDRYLKPKLRSKSANTLSYVEERVSMRFNLVPRGRKTWERGLYLAGQLSNQKKEKVFCPNME